MTKKAIDKIRLGYTRGIIDEDGEVSFPTLEELCMAEGCDYHEARKVSQKEHWSLSRRSARTALEDERALRAADEDRRKAALISRNYTKAVAELVEAFRQSIVHADDPRDLAALARSAPSIGAEINRMIQDE